MRKSWLGIVFAFFLQVIPGFSRGDKVIPQVADGGGYRTIFDLTNVSPAQAISGTFSLAFFQSNGTPWILKTNLSQTAASSFPLTLAPRQRLRVETSGSAGQTTSGYAVLQDREPNNTYYSMDYVIGISVFYQVSTGSSVTEVVSVPVPQPTAYGSVPLEVSQAKQVFTGFAMVNPTDSNATITFSIYPGLTGASTSTTIPLPAHQQVVTFFHQLSAFSALSSRDFQGIAEFKSDDPAISFLALQQTSAANGVQFSTAVATDLMALRNNTYLAVPEANVTDSTKGEYFMPVDLDRFVVDWSGLSGDEGLNWDLGYFRAPSGRSLRPFNGAQFSPIGVISQDAFNSLSLNDLKNRTYTTNNIDLTAGAPALQVNYTFAVKTDLGAYAKVRLFEWIETDGQDSSGRNIKYWDFIFSVVLYK